MVQCLLVKALLQRPHLDHMTVGFEPHLHYLRISERRLCTHGSIVWINIGRMEPCKQISTYIYIYILYCIYIQYVDLNILCQLQSYLTRHSVRDVSVTWHGHVQTSQFTQGNGQTARMPMSRHRIGQSFGRILHAQKLLRLQGAPPLPMLFHVWLFLHYMAYLYVI